MEDEVLDEMLNRIHRIDLTHGADGNRNQHGDLITNGAMGVDKLKEINGEKVNLFRFISILTPINAYMRKLKGDSWLLPQVAQLGGMVLKEGEWLWLNGEDLMSCFNLFRLPMAWRKYMICSKKVDAAAVGGKVGTET